MTNDCKDALLNVKMEEYKTLRQEILQCMIFRISIVTLGITGIGFLFGIAVTEYFETNYIASGILLLLSIPINRLILKWWLAETKRLRRAGYYICGLEEDVNEVKKDILNWESKFLRTKNDERKKSKYNYLPLYVLYKLVKVLIIVLVVLLVYININNGFENLVNDISNYTKNNRSLFYSTIPLICVIIFFICLILRYSYPTIILVTKFWKKIQTNVDQIKVSQPKVSQVKDKQAKDKGSNLFQDHYNAVILIFSFMLFISILMGIYTLSLYSLSRIFKADITREIEAYIISIGLILSFILTYIYYNAIQYELKLITDIFDKRNKCELKKN